MGRPKIKIIDDSQVELEVKDQNSKVKTSNENKRAKSEPVKAISEVEHTSEANDSGQETGAKQTDSERSGGASGALRPDEQVIDQKSDKRATEKKSQKPGKSKPRSKKYQEISKDLDKSKTYSLNEAIELVKKMSYSKFESTLEAHVNTSSTGIRGLVSLPFASGRKLRILAFGKNAQDSGADTVGSEEAIDEVNKGKINFDIVITTPEWMPKLAKIARILGPRGLMPNPKNGTITEDLKKAVEGFQAGKTEYKTEPKAAVIHISMGKLAQPNEELSANIKTLMQTLGKSRVKKITIAPTMGPGVKLDLSSI